MASTPRHCRTSRSSLHDSSRERWDALGTHRFSVDSLRQWLGWLRAMAREAKLDEDGGVHQLGALHESLLALRLEHLVSPARRLKRSRAWLRPARVLAWAPELRAKCLQRELGLSKHQVDAHGSALAVASTPEEVEAALSTLLDPRVNARGAGGWVVQPSSHRRHSGAHYTPWSMCSELVERTLEPLVMALPNPRSQALLELRVCDPAMGAGAFLVAATRYLAEVLVEPGERKPARTSARNALSPRLGRPRPRRVTPWRARCCSGSTRTRSR